MSECGRENWGRKETTTSQLLVEMLASVTPPSVSLSFSFYEFVVCFVLLLWLLFLILLLNWDTWSLASLSFFLFCCFGIFCSFCLSAVKSFWILSFLFPPLFVLTPGPLTKKHDESSMNRPRDEGIFLACFSLFVLFLRLFLGGGCNMCHYFFILSCMFLHFAFSSKSHRHTHRYAQAYMH